MEMRFFFIGRIVIHTPIEFIDGPSIPSPFKQSLAPEGNALNRV